MRCCCAGATSRAPMLAARRASAVYVGVAGLTLGAVQAGGPAVADHSGWRPTPRPCAGGACMWRQQRGLRSRSGGRRCGQRTGGCGPGRTGAGAGVHASEPSPRAAHERSLRRSNGRTPHQEQLSVRRRRSSWRWMPTPLAQRAAWGGGAHAGAQRAARREGAPTRAPSSLGARAYMKSSS